MLSAAVAAPVTYEYSITWQDGPVNGMTSFGWFSFDSSLIAPNATHERTDLLTGFGLSIGDRSYGLADVRSGFMVFDEGGRLDTFVMGNDCRPGMCAVSASTPGSFDLVYSGSPYWTAISGALAAGGPGLSIGAGKVLAVTVPEPATAALALLALGVSRRRRGHTAQARELRATNNEAAIARKALPVG